MIPNEAYELINQSIIALANIRIPAIECEAIGRPIRATVESLIAARDMIDEARSESACTENEEAGEG